MKELLYLVIHCTATPEGREVTADDIKHWHTDAPPKGRGWKQVGYTDIVHLNGDIERLVPNNEDNIVNQWEITNGVAGHNQHSRHIVYVGGVSADNIKIAKDTRTPAQREAMQRYVEDFRHRFPNVRIVGHNELAAKACPSFNVQKWLKSIGINQ